MKAKLHLGVSNNPRLEPVSGKTALSWRKVWAELALMVPGEQ